METGAVPGTRSIENSASLSGGREVISSGNTSGNSHATGISDNSTLTEGSFLRKEIINRADCTFYQLGNCIIGRSLFSRNEYGLLFATNVHRVKRQPIHP